ncbi:MAG: GspE/PulE family protein [Patescibacteria group bacterium]
MKKKIIVKTKEEKIPEIKAKVKSRSKKDIEYLIEKSKDIGAEELFDNLMIYAYGEGASDIHLEPWQEKISFIRLRKDGILTDEFEISHELNEQLVSRLKIMTRMRTDEHSIPQDGRFKFQSDDGTVDVRASVLPSSMGEKAVLRLLSSASHQLSLEQLGFSESDLKKVNRAIHRSWGMILSTGPTGSGKTTTIYGILEVVNRREVNISTIEDPVEYEMPGVTQSQVNEAKNFTFANGLRSLMRQDPDIIMVGEIRDTETAKIAVNAAMTGHKLFSTLHTNDAPTTIPRLIDLGAEPFLIASTLILAIAQRLVRKVCPDCVKKYTLTRKEAEKMLGAEMLEMLFGRERQVELAKAVGCEKCDTLGYKGRIGIFEVMENTPPMQELISKKPSREQIRAQALADGMTPLATDAVLKVKNFETTLEEIIRVFQEE